uniref:Uncharacterized protein n=1 Tax=Mola mola TaxID=94237 RepID=A0A3Q3VQQ5_MOLML
MQRYLCCYLNCSRPTVQYVASLSELPQALLPYYTQGYVLAALHPIILSVGRTRSLPFSLLYRMASMSHSVPMLRMEKWPLPWESLTGDIVRALIDRVGDIYCTFAQGGVRFIGSVLQQVSGINNGRMHSSKACCSHLRNPSGTPSGARQLEEITYSPDLRLLVFFHSLPPSCAPLDSLACQYHQGALSMRVSRKGQLVSALEADWLELTAAYYRKGWSLVDSFVYWDTPKGEPVPRPLEGLFVYEEKSTFPPANDTVVVKQWTVFEVSRTSVCHANTQSSQDNIAKQIQLLQNEMKAMPVHSDVSSHSLSRAVSSPAPPQALSPTAGGIRGFPAFGGGYPIALSHLEEGGFEQEEGKAQVTCM